MIGMVTLTLTLVATVIIGTILGLFYLKGIRKPVLIGTHIIVGMAGLEQLAVTLGGSPRGSVMGLHSFGVMAGLLFALALPFGILAPMIGRQSSSKGGAMLAVHICIAVTAFVLFLAWASGG